MINEARKRDHLANAVLALSFAANAAQSPKELVRSGNIEGPGIQVMSRMMKKRAEAERNLDSPRVSEPARNRKKKTFEEFVTEAYLIEIHKTKEDAADYYKDNPPVGGDPYYIRNKGKKGWAAIRKSSFKQQKVRRAQKLKPASQSELESQAKRTLRQNPQELGAIAMDREEHIKNQQRKQAKKLTKKTRIKHVIDHSQPQQDKRKPEYRDRFERVSPGDTSTNRRVISEPENLKKGSKLPKKGERGYGTTRSGANKEILDRGEKFSRQLDRLIAKVKENK
jgi:hypothetical protein